MAIVASGAPFLHFPGRLADGEKGSTKNILSKTLATTRLSVTDSEYTRKWCKNAMNVVAKWIPCSHFPSSRVSEKNVQQRDLLILGIRIGTSQSQRCRPHTLILHFSRSLKS